MRAASRSPAEATVLKDLLQPIMHLLFLRLADPDRCVVAAAQLRLVLSGALSLTEWNEAEEAYGAEQGWRSFAARSAPAGWLVAETYTDEWFSKGNVAIRAYYVCLAPRANRAACCTLTRADKWVGGCAAPSTSRRRWFCGVCGELHAMDHGVLC
eukprot:15444675-Alexandrium_andersonii.AAC.1